MPTASSPSVPTLALLLLTAGCLPALSPSHAAASTPENAVASGPIGQVEGPALPDPAAGTAGTGGPTGTGWTEGSEGVAPASFALESTQQGRKLVLDWTVTERTPARFRIQHPDGRIIATRDGRRSVQGWIASVRVAGWPRGLYLVTAEAGASRSSRTFILH